MTPRTFTAQLSKALREAAKRAPTADVEFDANRLSDEARRLARLLEARAK